VQPKIRRETKNQEAKDGCACGIFYGQPFYLYESLNDNSHKLRRNN